MSEERKKVLQMLKDGKITLDEANELLDNLDSKGKNSLKIVDRGSARRFIRIEVNSKTGDDVKVNIPLSLAKVAMNFIPEEAKGQMEENGIDLDDIIDAIEQGSNGELVNVDASDGDKVRIYLD